MSTMNIEVGETIATVGHFEAMPLGSVVRGDSTWTKVHGETWVSNRGETKLSSRFATNRLTLVSVPDGPLDPRFGTAVRSADTYEGLPVGSRVRGTRLWEKVEDGRWRRMDRTSEFSTTLSTAGDIRIVHVPGPAYPFAVGDGLDDISEFDRLPVGTIIGPGWGESYKKVSDADYRTCNREGEVTASGVHNPHSGSFSRGGYNKILLIPGVVTVNKDTYLQFKWKFRDFALQAAERNSIRRDIVEDVLRELDCTHDQFTLGTGVKVENSVDRNRLPEGSVIYVGDPERPDSFGLFGKKDGEWRWLMGGRNHIEYNSTTIDTLNGGIVAEPAWVGARGTEEDERLIREFKARAWRAGGRAKRANSWCGEFENMMNRLDITATSVLEGVRWNGIGIGQTVNAVMASTLPVGSVLKWVSSEDPNRFCYYRRVESSSNTANTLRLFGHHPTGGSLGHYNGSMTVEWINHEDFGDLNLRLPRMAGDNRLFEILTPGTIINSDGAGQRYMIARDHLSYSIGSANPTDIREAGQHRVVDYGTHTLIATHFPEVTP